MPVSLQKTIEVKLGEETVWLEICPTPEEAIPHLIVLLQSYQNDPDNDQEVTIFKKRDQPRSKGQEVKLKSLKLPQANGRKSLFPLALPRSAPSTPPFNPRRPPDGYTASPDRGESGS